MINLPLGSVMMDLQGFIITEEELALLKQPEVGGVILFTRNFSSLEQITSLVAEIKAIRRPALLVAVDHEGGRVQRFREGFTVLPALAKIGKLYDTDPAAAVEAARAHAWLMATELLATGVDFSFAPVLDVDIGLSSVIGDRSFHADKNIVAKLGIAYIEGMHKAGMAAVGKHFPGHGRVQGDTHKDKPIDCRSLEDILNLDGQPFTACIQAGLDAVMPAHVIYDAVDNCPAGYSSYWLQTVLRQQLGFKGAIFSDDLSMAGAETQSDKAISDAPMSYTQRAERALKAGCDMVLVCNNKTAATEVLENLDLSFMTEDALMQSKQRRLSMLARRKVDFAGMHANSLWQNAIKFCDMLNA